VYSDAREDCGVNELEKLVPLLNGLSDQAFSAFVLWWVGEYIIPSAWGVFAVVVIWKAIKFGVAAFVDAEKADKAKNKP